ncbi:uncharacterized protein N7511_002474 [Penicillium nucicola]|uniref:uncharacterized protein n=1 Tax=Penicillium nucicola TaxID=1850975 RepID=UPI00254584AE|nr:uncharacterized protein N7511_002474 [Penicillium nucicola]KAJ5770423.1 hypothetical protein N7511_002474 [Penicillium nucicola]
MMLDKIHHSLSKQQRESKPREPLPDDPQSHKYNVIRQVSREHVQLKIAVSHTNATISELTGLLAAYDVLLTEATSIDLNADCPSSQIDKSSYVENYCFDTRSLALMFYDPAERCQAVHWVVDEIVWNNIQLALALSCRNKAISEMTKFLVEYQLLLTHATASDHAIYSGDYSPSDDGSPSDNGSFSDYDSPSKDNSPSKGISLKDEDFPSDKPNSGDLDTSHISKQVLEPWSIERRCLDAHTLYQLYHDPFSLQRETFHILLNEVTFTHVPRDIKGNSPLLSTREYNRLFNPSSLQPEGTWIEDIWLCSTTDTLLAEAEQMWLDGDSQWAYEIADEISENPSLSRQDFVRCKTFLCAILHFHRDEHLSSQLFHKLYDSHVDGEFGGPGKEAYLGALWFIEAKSLMAAERFEDANWCFEETIMSTPQYSIKAGELQILCCSVDEFRE